MDEDDLVYLDESGFHTSMTRTHARSPRGERAYGHVPRNRGRHLTLLCAMTRAGPCADVVIEGGVDGAVFVTSLRDVLCPLLRAGQIVVMDNLGAHKRPEVVALIEARGAIPVYLPPYSPDLNPIELLFSKLKAAMRRIAARTRATVIAALGHALSTVSASDAAAWFRHCRSPQST
ncbi:IS630 family transposase [Deinococcus sp. AB2017081]|uniref:IS630 family transposase n=1 Tax=Deinococcus sp. AB2017081 TaxID=3093660 RepID=UPI002ACBDAFF|nr:IS630 family transposase [Deinococcus sp. AB2017081]WQE97201.1 IS630 family transposase [Deinococcus sp. AB2017081]